MGKKIHGIENVDEIHIEIDVLSTSESGIGELKSRYCKQISDRIICKGKIEMLKDLETERHKSVENEYFKIKKYVDHAREMKKQLATLKEAHKLQVRT